MRDASPEQERDAMQRLPGWQDLPPEEWVARNIHRYPLWGFTDYRFPTPAFDDWLREADRWVCDIDGRHALRRRFLTAGEIAEAEAAEAGPL